MTASFSALPALNAGFIDAATLIVSPVRGLRPSRAARLRTWNVPKPTTVTVSPFFTALVSTLTKIPVKADVAMTGEITLRGKVLGIGGLKEKLLAAMRGGIRTVIIPEENRKDLADIPKAVTQGMKIVPVRWIDEVLDLALERPLAPASAGSVGGVPVAEPVPPAAQPDVTH